MNIRTRVTSAKWSWIALGGILLLVTILRARRLSLPLERDEGEFAYVGQLLLQGIAPYKTAYVIKLPGTAALYALSMALFGQTAAGIHLGLLLANVTAIVLLFLLAKKWFDSNVAVVAAATYALMSLSWCCSGLAAHATQFVVPAALGGILVLERGLVSGRLATLFGSGLLFGLAFLLKQPGLLFGAFGGFYLAAHEWRGLSTHRMASLKRIAAFGMGTALPFLLLCGALAAAGVFDRFWYWSFTVAGEGWTPLEVAWFNLVEVAQWTWSTRDSIFWALAAATFLAGWWLPAVRPVRWRFLAFCVTSVAATSLGLRFNPHYFVLSLPAAGLLVGVAVAESGRALRKNSVPAWISGLPALAFVALCAIFLLTNANYLFVDTMETLAKRLYDNNPFVEAVPVAEYIRQHSANDAKIAVLGSEPEIYFLARRHAATGHVSTYLLTQGRPWSLAMQEEMSREIIAAQPEYIVLVNSLLSWLVMPSPRDPLLAGLEPFIKSRYQAVGVAVCHSGLGDPVYYWDEAVRAPHPQVRPDTSALYIYKLQKPAPAKN